MSTFGKAFASARKAGKSSFSYQGKSYNTKVASTTPKKAPRPTPRPDAATKTASATKASSKVALPRVKAALAGTPKTGASAYPANMSSRKSVSNDTARYNMAKAGPRDLPGKAFAGAKPLSIGARIADSVRIGAKAVDRGARRDAAAAANKDAKSAVQSMLDGMGKKTKRK